MKILEGKVAAACQERDTIQRELQSRVKLLEGMHDPAIYNIARSVEGMHVQLYII